MSNKNFNNIQSYSITLAGADDDGIASSQTPAAGGTQLLTINGILASNGVATLDVARKVIITSGGNDSSRTFVVTGTNALGVTISENITGANIGVATSILDYKTVSSVSINGNSAGTVKVGTNTSAATPFLLLDLTRTNFQVSMAVELSSGASLNYTVQHTFTADPNRSQSPVVFDNDDSALVSATANKAGNYIVPVVGVRVKLNTFTSGTLTLKVIQAGKDGK